MKYTLRALICLLLALSAILSFTACDGGNWRDDRTAAEASRRAFKVAEIFLLEAARHRPSRSAAPSAPEAAETEPTPAAE